MRPRRCEARGEACYMDDCSKTYCAEVSYQLCNAADRVLFNARAALIDKACKTPALSDVAQDYRDALRHYRAVNDEQFALKHPALSKGKRPQPEPKPSSEARR